jgi:hypothetical protein
VTVPVEGVGRAIHRLLTAAEPPEPGAALREIVDLCAAALPHPDWAALRALDYEAELPALRAWFERVLEEEPPPAPLRGLFFTLCHPMPDAETVTTDLELVGTGAYDPADPQLRWLHRRSYFPERYAGSAALDQLYAVAHGTHEFGREVEDTLGQDAEWPVGLAFAVVVARAILEGRTPAELPTDAETLGIAAGWEGDLLLIGELTAAGFVPTQDTHSTHSPPLR